MNKLSEVNSTLEEKLNVIKELDKSDWNPFEKDTRTKREKRIDYDALKGAVDSINSTLLKARYSDEVNAVEVKTKMRFKRYIKHLLHPGKIGDYRYFLEEFLKTALNRKRFPGTVEYTFYKKLSEINKEWVYEYNFLKNNLKMEYHGFYSNLVMNLNEPPYNKDDTEFKAYFFADELESIKLVKIKESELTPNLRRKWTDEDGYEYYLK